MFTLRTQCQTTLTLTDFCPYYVQEFGISKGFPVHTVQCNLNSRKNAFLKIFKHSEDHIYSLQILKKCDVNIYVFKSLGQT
jgi:hypothetical protein